MGLNKVEESGILKGIGNKGELIVHSNGEEKAHNFRRIKLREV